MTTPHGLVGVETAMGVDVNKVKYSPRVIEVMIKTCEKHDVHDLRLIRMDAI